MNQRWDKLGLLYKCERLHPKLMTHTANPLAIHLEDDVYRVFFSARDQNQRSSVGGVDIDIVTGNVVEEHDTPFFSYGAESSFYSHGVSIGDTYEIDGVTYMLFMGWKRPEEGHWFGEIGRLVVNQDLTLRLESETPFLGLDEIDPISLSYPCVLKDTNKYKMWYGSTESWTSDNDEMVHLLKYAESGNGTDWVKKGLAIPYKIGIAQAFSRPTIYQGESGSIHMWYSFRSGAGDTYRIGYSDSVDAQTWSATQTEVSLSPSVAGWDAEMVEYPFVLTHKKKLYMLYNGDSYGYSGFGIAVSDSEW